MPVVSKSEPPRRQGAKQDAKNASLNPVIARSLRVRPTAGPRTGCATKQSRSQGPRYRANGPGLLRSARNDEITISWRLAWRLGVLAVQLPSNGRAAPC